MEQKDHRIRIINEILSGIKVRLYPINNIPTRVNIQAIISSKIKLGYHTAKYALSLIPG